jgi:hypothetical protein
MFEVQTKIAVQPEHSCNAFCSGERHAEVIYHWAAANASSTPLNAEQIAADYAREGYRVVDLRPAPEVPPPASLPEPGARFLSGYVVIWERMT